MGKSSTNGALTPKLRYALIGSLTMMAAGGTLTSCSGDSDFGSSLREGYIHLATDLNTEVRESSNSKSRAGVDITAEDLTLTLTSADGQVNRTYSSINEFDAEEAYRVGDYTFTAFYGSEESEGFEVPYYFGSTNFSVVNGRVTEVELTVSLANTMVTVIPTEAFKSYFGNKFSATLHSVGGSFVEYAADETRPAYLRPGNVTLTASVTLPTGSSATLQVGTFEAEPRTHYKVTMDLADNFGEAVLVVTFDDMTSLQPVSITLSDDMVNSPAPVLTLQGTEAATPLVVTEGNTPASDVRVDVHAEGQLKSLTLTTTGNPELLAAGWPAEVDLVSASEAEIAAMSALGFRAWGATMSNTKWASVVFTDLIPSLRGQGATFTLRATDRFGKVSDPVSLQVSLLPQVLKILSTEPVESKAETMTINIQYNGTADPSTLSFLIAEEGSENWIGAKVVSVTPGAIEGTYVVVIEIPASMKSFRLKVKSQVAETGATSVQRELVPVIVNIPEGSVWATKVYATLSSEVYTAQELSNATFKVETSLSARSGNTEISNLGDGKYLISGLEPASNYSLKAVVNGEESDAVEITTEAEIAVPNGDFEDLVTTINSNIQQGGLWTITALGSATRYSTSVDIAVKEPKGWASTNAKTFYAGASNLNSWYTIPSVFNSGVTWITHQPTCKVMGIGQTGYDETPAEYQNLSASSGSNAMVIRNVAWDANGAEVPYKSQTGNTSYSNYYCSNVPTVANRSAGKLFLGSYGFNGSTETLNQGVDFTSRPESLTGDYKYVCDSQDTSETGVVTVEILSGNEVIASGTQNLGAVGDYTRFTVPLAYKVIDRKATSLRIMFCSSNRDESSIMTTNYCNKLECCSRGASLTVDNLKFIY